MVLKIALERCSELEWGHETMKQKALDRMASSPSIDAVEVQEHGGWFLTFNREGLIIDTANDMACLSGVAREWLKQFNSRTYVVA